MGFAVFIHRADSPYEDSPATQYQFPSQYLSRVSASVGDWIVYYEPTKVSGSRGYNAIARVERVVPDPVKPNMYLALIAAGSYLPFPNPVPFMVEDGLAETGLLNAEGRVSGRAQAAVRPISPKDFDRIMMRGFAEDRPVLPRVGEPETPFQLDEPQAPFAFEQERERVETLTSRVIRDRVFRRVVLRAYNERCAVTGLKLINGLGRAEVAAAHIRPVERNGPDIANNGVALSGTAHWMFDRGLITFTDGLDIVISRHVNDRDGAMGLINQTGRLIGPQLERDRPHPAFLAWHRENCFKH
ncbi:MAG: HNH endonuclease [Devosia nanyangense]|uniref:HNH endonuclease n=1 Tax=Devosia nanyangense TaxID=1228055 RepID=A0A933L186_9HYPH|nr:HNH endonuclease [Devosia nanyangense]